MIESVFQGNGKVLPMFKVLPDKKEATLLWSFDAGGAPEKTFRTERVQ